MGQGAAGLFGEIAELARGSATRREFRCEAAARLRPLIGFDGVAWGPIPPGAPGTPLEYYGEHVPAASLVAMAGDPPARADIVRAQIFLDAHKVAVDGGFVARDKSRSSFFMGFLAPMRVGTYVSALLGSKGRVAHSSLRLTREHSPFREREVSVLRLARPLLLVAEALLDRRLLSGTALRRLTLRQRVIVQHVANGFTNPEIAHALGISRNTVRNRLADVFERLGVSTRAELVAVAGR